MRIGDLDALFVKFWEQGNPFDERPKVHPSVVWSVAATLTREASAIDLETLPIVRQLRAELERVTAERDAAIKDIEAAMGSESTQNILKYLCSLCQNKDLNRGCTCDGKCAPKWRGAHKEE